MIDDENEGLHATLETFCAFQLFNCCIMISLLLLSLGGAYCYYYTSATRPVV